MKRLLLFSLLPILFTGCMKPFHEPVFVDVKTSEVAFVMQTMNGQGQVAVSPDGKGDNVDEKYYAERYVNARRIEVPYFWKTTSRVWFYDSVTNGEWQPAARVIAVNTEVETREWTAESHSGSTNKNQAIWVESLDSVGFSTGISITANIANKDDAITFLSNYPPKTTRDVPLRNGDIFTVEVTSLEQIMDSEIRTKVQEIYSYVSAGYEMDILRNQKQYIIDIVKNGGKVTIKDALTGESKEVEIEGAIPYFKEKGITITALGQFGGFTYENPENQKAIDDVFKAQQDKQVAKAEFEAAEVRKDALKSAGEGEAAKILESRRGEAEGIKLVAEARANEIQLLQQDAEMYLNLQYIQVARDALEKWDGSLPKAIFGGETIVDTQQFLNN